MRHRVDLEQLPDFIDEEEDALRQLHRWLKYEGLVPLGGAFAFFTPYGLVVLILAGTAVAFTPYLLYQLWRARWWKSIVTFVVVVLAPLGFWLAGFGDELGQYLLSAVPLAAFFVYTWILRLVIGEDLQERSAVRLFDYERERG